jgi:hypothetical protein
MANTRLGRVSAAEPQARRLRGTSPVGTLPVWEWASDFFTMQHDPEPRSPCCAPSVIERVRFPRKVIKGGSHLCAPSYCPRYRPGRPPGRIDRHFHRAHRLAPHRSLERLSSTTDRAGARVVLKRSSDLGDGEYASPADLLMRGMKSQSVIRVMERPTILEWSAWRRYLTATRARDARTYSVFEKAAWERLQADLASIGSSLPLEGSALVEEALVGAEEDPREEVGIVARRWTIRRLPGLLRRR